MKRRIYLPCCAACVSADKSPVKMLDGQELPYSGGLTDCSKRKSGVGYYPYQQHSCTDFDKKNHGNSKGQGKAIGSPASF